MKKLLMLGLSAGLLAFAVVTGSDAAILQAGSDLITNGGGHPILPPV
ncbi:hypothetical protein [Mesobacillus campisalis]|nr:hypothetical protein [Mesobacillus campisalis]